jgi:hypothetical protein
MQTKSFLKGHDLFSTGLKNVSTFICLSTSHVMNGIDGSADIGYVFFEGITMMYVFSFYYYQKAFASLIPILA